MIPGFSDRFAKVLSNPKFIEQFSIFSDTFINHRAFRFVFLNNYCNEILTPALLPHEMEL